MTLADLESDVYQRLNFDDAPPETVVRRIRSFINKWHRKILSAPRFVHLRDGLYALTSVTGQAIYGLPPIIGRINHLTQRTNNLVLQEQSLDWLRLADPGLLTTGGPSAFYIPLGLVAVAQQPADASQVFVKSTSASDVGTAYVEGFRTGGYIKAMSVTMTGTTAVSLDTATSDLIEVTKFYLSANAIGTVTLHEDSGAGTELARIPIGQQYARYVGIQLWPAPAGEVYYLDFTRNLLDLLSAADEPLLPPDFHWVLSSGAEYEELRKQDDRRRTEVWQEIELGLNDLNHYVNNPPGYRPVSGGRIETRSRLGAYFPAGT